MICPIKYLGDSLHGDEPARPSARLLWRPHARQRVHEVGAVLGDAPLREELDARQDRGEERREALRGEEREAPQGAGADVAEALQEVV